ncbi:MAG TPA: TrkH family potassium uptake protein [Acidimicrobiales bacterium]
MSDSEIRIRPSASPRTDTGSTVVHIVALGVAAVSAGMVVSAAVDVVVDGGDFAALVGPGLVGGGGGLLAARRTRVAKRLTPRIALITVAATWTAVSVWGAVPYLLADIFPYPDDALLEAVSGFTGTGSTVLVPIEGTGRGILFWRQLTQWYGGMGVVVLAVAVLPFIGVGGMELMRSEAPGPTADRLTPRVGETARRLWLIYVVLTVGTIVALLVTGLSVYDAVAHAFSTVSTGGFSPYDASIGHFDSVAVEGVLVVVMLLGGTSFTLHWLGFARRGGWRTYWEDTNFRFYMALFAIVTVLITASLVADGGPLVGSGRTAMFTVASLLTETGVSVADFTVFAPVAQILIVFIMMTGGMAGSTAGGMKLLRVHVLFLHALREAKRARHPRAVLPLRLGRSVISEPIVARVAGFVMLYVAIGIAGVVVVSLLGAHTELAIGGVATAMGNSGPGLAEAGANLLPFTRPARFVLVVLMLVGRLEILAVAVGIGALLRPLSVAARRVLAR